MLFGASTAIVRIQERDMTITMSSKNKRSTSQYHSSKTARFFTVGASGLALNYIVSFLLSNVVSSLWYIQATVFGIVLSISSNFLLNKVWTFEDRDFSARCVLRQYLSFFALCTQGLVIQLSLVFVFVEYSHMQYATSLILAVCIASVDNFLIKK